MALALFLGDGCGVEGPAKRARGIGTAKECVSVSVVPTGAGLEQRGILVGRNPT